MSIVRLVNKRQLSPAQVKLVASAKVIDFVGYGDFHFSKHYRTPHAETVLVRKSSSDFHYNNIKSCYFPHLKMLYLDNHFVNSDILAHQLNDNVDVYHETIYDKEHYHPTSGRIHMIYPNQLKKVLHQLKQEAIVLK